MRFSNRWPVLSQASAMNLVELNEATRVLMLDELQMDQERGELYISKRLSQAGRGQYPQLLHDALAGGTPATLAEDLRQPGVLNASLVRRDGRLQAMPSNAPDMLAEGEFNRFYVRAVCRLALDEGLTEVLVYRAKHVAEARADSERRVGVYLDATQLLDDLRQNVGAQAALGVPNGPNSGLSVRLPDPD